MVKVKDGETKDEVVEIEVLREETEDGEQEAEEEEDGDVEVEDGILDEDLILGEEDSDFFIGDTILSSGDVEQDWSVDDLEEVVRGERIDKDWEDSEEFVGGDFYNVAAGGGDFYGTDGSREGVYEDKLRGEDLYKENRGGDLYNTGEEGVYAAKTNEEGVYDVSKRGTKSYEEVVDNRRKGRSVLEMAGFEDKEKQKDRDTHDLMKYSAKKAA